MRITCPHCAAHYEIDAALIPDEGRSVQCSACDHVWDQKPPDNADEEAGGAPPPERVQRPKLDDRTRQILEEEARHAAETRTAPVSPEATRTAPPVSPEASRTVPPAAPAVASPRPVRPKLRNDLLPDLEESSASLNPAPGARAVPDGADPDPAPATGGFLSGFGVVLLAAIVLVALYLAAPRIAERVPALEEPLSGYVTAVNEIRRRVDGSIQTLARSIADLAG